MRPRAKKCWRRPELEEAGTDSALQPTEEVWPWQHFDFGFLASRTVKGYIFVVLSYSVCGDLLQQQ